MKIIGALLLKYQNSNVAVLESEFDLSLVGFFSRFSMKELLIFFTTEIVKKNYQQETTNDGKLQILLHEQTNNNLCFIHKNDMCVCIICDQEYPKRIIYDLINSAIENKINLKYIVNECSDPAKIDQIAKIQKKLDETKDVLYDTIDKVLERGEKLDILVEKSGQLSHTSKLFYKQSKRMNDCCTVI